MYSFLYINVHMRLCSQLVLCIISNAIIVMVTLTVVVISVARFVLSIPGTELV